MPPARDDAPQILVILLAAGSGKRFGDAKLIQPLRGRPVVQWSVQHALATHADGVVVVLGAGAGRVREALTDAAVQFVVNDDHEAGMGSSIAAGVAAVAGNAAAVIVALGDQPDVPPAVFDALRARFLDARFDIVAPIYENEEVGPPVLFSARLFEELLALRGDTGARTVLERDPSRVSHVRVEVPFPADIDTPADLARLETGS